MRFQAVLVLFACVATIEATVPSWVTANDKASRDFRFAYFARVATLSPLHQSYLFRYHPEIAKKWYAMAQHDYPSHNQNAEDSQRHLELIEPFTNADRNRRRDWKLLHAYMSHAPYLYKMDPSKWLRPMWLRQFEDIGLNKAPSPEARRDYLELHRATPDTATGGIHGPPYPNPQRDQRDLERLTERLHLSNP